MVGFCVRSVVASGAGAAVAVAAGAQSERLEYPSHARPRASAPVSALGRSRRHTQKFSNFFLPFERANKFPKCGARAQCLARDFFCLANCSNSTLVCSPLFFLSFVFFVEFSGAAIGAPPSGLRRLAATNRRRLVIVNILSVLAVNDDDDEHARRRSCSRLDTTLMMTPPSTDVAAAAAAVAGEHRRQKSIMVIYEHNYPRDYYYYYYFYYSVDRPSESQTYSARGEEKIQTSVTRHNG